MGRGRRWDSLPEQTVCHGKSCLQMGVPTRGTKPKRSLRTVAVRGVAAARPCQQRNMGSFRRAGRQEAVED